RQASGHFAEPDPQQLFINSIVIFFYWFLGFIFWGLYRSWHAHSRVDEFISVLKVITIGVFLIFLITFDLSTDVENPLPASRAIMVTYWLLMIVYVNIGRMLLRTFQRTLLESGIGERKALIVGWGEKARTLFDEVINFPALGYRLIGFVDTHNPSVQENYRGCSVVGSLQDLDRVIEQEEVDEILIAIDDESHQQLLETLSLCITKPVKIKTTPSLYDIAAGQVRTHQIYGLPLIDVMAEPMPQWEYSVKRLIDIFVSLIILALSSPLWLSFRLKKERGSRNTLLQKSPRTGKNFRVFEMYSFQHVVPVKNNAPAKTTGLDGSQNKGRIPANTLVAKLPRLINVLKGEMSLIGPRPERVEIAEKLKREVLLYHRRTAVRPGLIGWAQLKGEANESIDNIKRTLQYDFFYIENMSLRMDLKIFLVAVYMKLFGKRMIC
ncbi:MAG: sugar transferase, partial [bacterium]